MLDRVRADSIKFLEVSEEQGLSLLTEMPQPRWGLSPG